MPRLSHRSKKRLATCHPDLQRLCNELIKEIDFTVIFGHRSVEEQQKLYAKGRSAPGPKVTNCDGIRFKSRHNYKPSLAVDLAPYPIDWQDIERFKDLGARAKQVADRLGIKVSWGGDWKWKDYPHFELPKSSALHA